MDSISDNDDLKRGRAENGVSWTLVRTPLRRHSSGHCLSRKHGEDSGNFIRENGMGNPVSNIDYRGQEAFDDRDAIENFQDNNEIRLNPWTTYRRAPRSVTLPDYKGSRRPLPHKPRPALDLSILDNLTPVGQVVTYRKVPVLPDYTPDTNNQTEAVYVNTAFQREQSWDDEDPVFVTSATKYPFDNTPDHGFSIQCNGFNSAQDIQLKDLNIDKHNNTTEIKNTNMKSPSSSLKLKQRLHGYVNSVKVPKKREDSQSERLEDNLADSSPGDDNLSDEKIPDKHPNKRTDKTKDDEGPKPFIYCRIITRYPKTTFLLTFAGHMLIALATVSLLLSGYNLFPTDFETLPMSDWKVPWKRRDFAWRYRDEYNNRYVRKWFIQDQHKWYRSMAYERSNIVLYYDAGTGNIFDKENLQRIKDIEDRIFNITEYREYCVQNTAMTCQKPTSILRLFDGSYSLLDPKFFDPGFNNIPEVLYAANTNNYTKSRFAFFLSKDAILKPHRAYSTVTRTVIPMGYPLKVGEHSESMENRMESFLVKHFKPVIGQVTSEDSNFRVIYWSYLLFRHDIVIQILYDSMFAGGSAMFIFLFIVYHTKSLWISTLSLFSILTSFLATNILYRTVLDYQYFGFFHVIAFFIILGIGADDLFVFLDVWKSTGFKKYPSLSHRLSDAYKKSALSMFFTSLTTAVAFFANAFSPLLAPQSFGIFAGLLVIVNYLSVIVYFPTVVIIHHLYFKKWTWPCLRFLNKNKKSDNVDDNQSVESADIGTPGEVRKQSLFVDNTSRSSTGHLYNVVGELNSGYNPDSTEEYGFCRDHRTNSETLSTATLKNNEVLPRLSSVSSKTGIVLSAVNDLRGSSNNTCPSKDIENKPEVCETDLGEVKSTKSSQDGPKKKRKKKKALVLFFRNHYYRFVTHWLIRWIIVVVLISVVAFFAYSITKLETENEQVQLYRNSHNYGRALDLDFHYFVANEADRNVKVHIVWGLKPRDMSVCHFSDGRCEGVERYDEHFDPNTPEAQLALKKFCDKLHSFTDDEIEYYSIRRHFISRVPEIRCFTDEIDGYLKEQSEASGMNLSLPWNYRTMIEFMQSKSDMYNTEKFDKNYTDFLQVPLSYWMNDGYKFEDKSVFYNYHSLIGESISEYSTPLKTDMSVFVGNKIRYIGVQVNLTLGTYTSGYPLGKPAMDRWETFVQTEMKKMPEGMKNGFQLTRNYWHSISVQKTMADNAILGIVIGIIFAFPILTVATQNVIIAFFAIVCMCCSTVCVIGVIPLAGWKLGILESLNMCMVVGLTVDYVVHLAEGYHMSLHTDRQSRVRDMLELMGISVFSGACTTLGASLFMVFAQIQFIIRFGIFMFCTIGFSLLYSLGLFTTLMGILGPSGQTGDVTAICGWGKRLLSRQK